MSFVRNDIRVGHACEVTRSPLRMELRQPTPRITPCKRVQRCYTLMQAAEAVGIQDLADGEFLPTDKTLEDGIERQNDYLLDQVGCTRPGFRLLEIGFGYGRLLRMARTAAPTRLASTFPPSKSNIAATTVCRFIVAPTATCWNRQNGRGNSTA